MKHKELDGQGKRTWEVGGYAEVARAGQILCWFSCPSHRVMFRGSRSGHSRDRRSSGFVRHPPLKLEKNMCFAVEVGCFTWDGKKWAKDGAKLEHCGRVTDTGFEVFYRFPMKDLIACGLPGVY